MRGAEYPAFDFPKYSEYGVNAFLAIYHSNFKETLEAIGNIYGDKHSLK